MCSSDLVVGYEADAIFDYQAGMLELLTEIP